MLALQASAAFTWFIAISFGAPTAFVATHLLRERKLPNLFVGLFFAGPIVFGPGLVGVSTLLVADTWMAVFAMRLRRGSAARGERA